MLSILRPLAQLIRPLKFRPNGSTDGARPFKLSMPTTGNGLCFIIFTTSAYRKV